MLKKAKKRHISLTQRDGLHGLLFLIPWLIGFIFFFAIPMAKSIFYSFNEVSFGDNGLLFEYVGLKNYTDVLFENKTFWKAFIKVLNTLLYKVPVIVLFSMFIALLLNRKIAGRTFFRTVFFIPLVIMSGTVLSVVSGSALNPSLAESSNAMLAFDFGAQGFFSEMLSAIGLSGNALAKFSGLINNIFEISWKSSIQIVLYIVGLQSIPASYYEVCEIEGATKWESFWKITFPMLSPITLLCLVFTIVDTFTDANSAMIIIINNAVTTSMHTSATLSWCYFLFVFVYTMIVIGVVSRWVKYMD